MRVQHQQHSLSYLHAPLKPGIRWHEINETRRCNIYSAGAAAWEETITHHKRGRTSHARFSARALHRTSHFELPGPPANRAALLVLRLGPEPFCDALQVEGVATGAPHDWAVVPRVLALWGAAIKRVPADAAHVVACVPRPHAYCMPLLNADLERHAVRWLCQDQGEPWVLCALSQHRCSRRAYAAVISSPARGWPLAAQR